jgi:hypothetical protein
MLASRIFFRVGSVIGLELLAASSTHGAEYGYRAGLGVSINTVANNSFTADLVQG